MENRKNNYYCFSSKLDAALKRKTRSSLVISHKKKMFIEKMHREADEKNRSKSMDDVQNMGEKCA